MAFWTQYWQDLKKDFPTMFGVSLIVGAFICVAFSSSGTPPNRMVLYSIHGSLISLFLWWGNAFIVDFLNYRYSWFEDAKIRVTFGVLGSLLFTIIGFVVIQMILMRFFYGQPIRVSIQEFRVSNLYLPIILTGFITLTAHLVAFFNEWRKAELEKEALKREHLASQFETLKSQVNPHFLFNSLNALSTLVYKDQDVAAQFIQQLSKVYRHVLETQSKEIVSLSTELKALEAYIFLIKIRFGENLNVNLEIPSTNYNIAPLALQMLVENAIKHNIVSKSKHLTIDIYKENQYIVVSNNLQKKKNVTDSSGIGLANIQARYQYIAKKEILIEETTEAFIVKIPLLDFE